MQALLRAVAVPEATVINAEKTVRSPYSGGNETGRFSNGKWNEWFFRPPYVHGESAGVATWDDACTENLQWFHEQQRLALVQYHRVGISFGRR